MAGARREPSNGITDSTSPQRRIQMHLLFCTRAVPEAPLEGWAMPANCVQMEEGGAWKRPRQRRREKEKGNNAGAGGERRMREEDAVRNGADTP